MVATPVGDWAEEQRVLRSSPNADKTWKLPNVPVSRVLNPQKQQTGDSVRGIPSLCPYVHPPQNPESDKGVKNKQKLNVNICSSAPLVYPPCPISSSSFRVPYMRRIVLKVSPCSEVGFPAHFGSAVGQVLDHFKAPGCNRCFINRSRLN